MDSSPSLSVLVVTHDNRTIIGGLLDDVRRSADPTTRVVVVDDSVDGTADLVEEYLAHHALAGWSLVRIPHRVGVCEARNLAWRASEGPYLLYLDSDVRIAEPGVFRSLSDYLASHPEIGILCPVVRWLDGRVQSSGIAPPVPGLFPYFPFCRLDTVPPTRPTFTFAPHGAAMLVRREVMERIGGFDESLNPGFYEEMDLSWRTLIAGYGVAVVPACSVLHATHATFGRLAQPRRLYLNLLHQARAIFKNAPASALPVLLFVVPAAGLVTEVLRLIETRNVRVLGSTVRVLIALTAAAPALFRQRRAIVGDRNVRARVGKIGAAVPESAGP